MSRIHSDKNLQSFCDKLPTLKPTQVDIKEMTELFMLIKEPEKGVHYLTKQMKMIHPKIRIPYFYLFDNISQICSKYCDEKKLLVLQHHLKELFQLISEMKTKYPKNLTEVERITKLWLNNGVYSKHILDKNLPYLYEDIKSPKSNNSTPSSSSKHLNTNTNIETNTTPKPMLSIPQIETQFINNKNLNPKYNPWKEYIPIQTNGNIDKILIWNIDSLLPHYYLSTIQSNSTVEPQLKEELNKLYDTINKQCGYILDLMYYNSYHQVDVENITMLKSFDDNISLPTYNFENDGFKSPKEFNELTKDEKRKLSYRIRHSCDIYNGIKKINCRPDIETIWTTCLARINQITNSFLLEIHNMLRICKDEGISVLIYTQDPLTPLLALLITYRINSLISVENLYSSSFHSLFTLLSDIKMLRNSNSEYCYVTVSNDVEATKICKECKINLVNVTNVLDVKHLNDWLCYNKNLK